MAQQQRNLGCAGTIAVFALGGGAVALGVGLIEAVLGEDKRSNEMETETQQTAPMTTTTKPNKAQQPDVSVLYRLTSDDYLGSMKRTVSLEIDRPLTENELKAIGQRIHEQAKRQTDRTFINVELPGVDVKPWAHWAVIRWEPESPGMRVRINGDAPASD